MWHHGWHVDGTNAHLPRCECDHMCKVHEKNHVWGVSVYIILLSLKSTGGKIYWMTGSWEICHDSWNRRVYRCKFRTTSLLIQAPWKTNDREGICEHNPQLSVTCTHIFLCFLLLPIQCRCTLTWRWSCLWSSQAHTVRFLGIFSTRTPSAFRRFDSYPWSYYFPNTIKFCSSRSQ